MVFHSRQMLSSRSSSPTLVINTSNRQSKPLHLRRSLSKPLHYSHHRTPLQSLASSSHANPPLTPLLPSPGKTSQTSTLGHHVARPTGSRGRALSRSAASMQRAGGSWPHGTRHEVGLWCLRSAPLRWWPPQRTTLFSRRRGRSTTSSLGNSRKVCPFEPVVRDCPL